MGSEGTFSACMATFDCWLIFIPTSLLTDLLGLGVAGHIWHGGLHRNQLLGNALGAWIEARARTACEDDALYLLGSEAPLRPAGDRGSLHRSCRRLFRLATSSCQLRAVSPLRMDSTRMTHTPGVPLYCHRAVRPCRQLVRAYYEHRHLPPWTAWPEFLGT